MEENLKQKEQEQEEAETNNLDSEEINMESSLDSVKEEVAQLEEELKEELEVEERISDRFSKLREEITAAQEIEEQILEIEKELALEQEEKEKYMNRLQRLKADFSNYKKRITKEKERISTQATKDFVIDLLPIIDNFERALGMSQDSKEVADVLEGVEMIYRQLTNLLKKKDVKEVPTVGEEFDPNIHEAVMNETTDEYESGIVTEELQKGYKLDDLVVRPAMVKVAE
ncbi:molecular chaperone GrpE (heat shock protein) [Halobacteroides halobius DSM 5150]|uniref:Protein GrpE n=1 Tax=Halobacteroides halobius (strain ATCC 35273 / DSM 5150 / MD-1) TaxID=748449 RepID=L0KBA6_HALHC|nr:nucleotide exchange factor GrpE [Halobacteroides halobius]AGB41810.1 molecular chaperone GrpE (heat shock protein) [Halobacteroides halobius DSM 5150]